MATYYFDTNGATAGFGSAVTANWTGTSYWSTSSTGVLATTTWPGGTHDVYFGSATTIAPGNTVTIPSGQTVNVSSLNFPNSGSGTTTVTFAGTGKLDFGSTKVPVVFNSLAYLSSPFTGTNGFEASGSSLLIMDQPASTNSISGTLSLTGNGNGAIILRSSNTTGPDGATFFSSLSTVDYPGAAGTTPPCILVQSQALNAISTFPATLSFTGANIGRVQLQGDVQSGIVNIRGSVTGLAGYDGTNLERCGVALYSRGTLNLVDLPRQLSFFSFNGESSTCNVSVPSGSPTYPTTVHVAYQGGTATSPTFTLASGGASAFSMSGGLKRTTGSSAVAVTFILRGVNTGLNTLSGGTTATSGTLALQKQDAGTWVLDGDNSALSSVLLGGGRLRATNSNAIGGALTMSASTVFEVAGGITLGNATILNGIGTIRSVSGANSITVLPTLAGATTIGCTAGSLNFSNSSGTWGGSNINLTFGEAGDTGSITVAGALPTGTGTLTKSAAGTLTLNGANSFSGLVTINAGVVEANTITASGNNSLGTNSALSMTSSTLRYTGSTPANLAKSVTATGATGLAFENTGTSGLLVGSSVVMPTSNTVLGLGGTNTGYNLFTAAPANLVGITKAGASRWILTGGKDMTGTTDVNAGTLMASNVNSNLKLLGSTVNVAAGAKIQTGSDTAQGGKCTYTSLAFNGAVGNKARIRIGGSAMNPAIYITGTLTVPAGGMTWSLAESMIFAMPGTYTLVEFGPSGALSGSVSNITVTNPPAGRTVVPGSLTYNSGSTPKTITVQIA